MTSTDDRADVAIVGYGPVGATLAILLAQLGHSVVILERWPQPYPLPRAVHMDDHVTRIFQACGLGDQLPGITEPAPVYEWRNGTGTTLLRLGRAGLGPSGWPASSMFSQPALEARLRERVDALGVDVRAGDEVVALTQDDGGVHLTTAAGAQTSARYVVGCDGANSTVRRLTDLPVVDLGFFYDWLIVDVILAEARVFDPINLQVCDPARPTTAVSGGPGRRRWEFMRLPAETVDELSSEERAWSLLAGWDVHPGNATIERHAVYTFAARYAESWRSGRVFLAGDAAHQMPPFAGQGMCAGIRDAANLSWKLDLVLRGRAGGGLLDTYDAERRPDVRAAIEFSMELGRVICVPDPAAAAARDEAMAGDVGDEPAPLPERPPLDAGLIAAGTGRAGHLLPQGQTADGRFDDRHGAGWHLILRPGSPEPAGDDVAWFTTIGGRIRAADADDTVLGSWFDGAGCAAALQRPDFHLYGTAATAEDIPALLAGLQLALSPAPKETAAP